MPVLPPRFRELSALKDKLLDEMTNEDHDLVASCADPVEWHKTLEIRAAMNAKWKRIEEKNRGIYYPPKAEVMPDHPLPDVRAYSLKYGRLKQEAKDAERDARRKKKTGGGFVTPDKQEIED